MKTITACVLALFGFIWTAAADVNSDFTEANNLYAQGKFTEAATAYEKIISTGGANATLYFNLGNAQFKSRQFGCAIAAYRHAGRLSPRDADIRANLQFARNQVAGNDSVRPNLWQRALGRLTLNEWTLLAVTTLWIWLGVLALCEGKQIPRPRLSKLASVAGLLTVLLGVCVIGDWLANQSAQTAVVIVKDGAVKTGPLDDSQNAFLPKDGTELTVLDRRDDWLQVSDGHNRIGWLKRDSVQLL